MSPLLHERVGVAAVGDDLIDGCDRSRVKSDPVSYTHLDVYKRQAESLGSFAVSMVSVVLFFVVWAAISSFLQPRIVRRSIRELVSRESEDRGILGKHSLLLDDTGIVEETSVNKTVTRYEGVHRLEESDELLLVYLSANGAQIIPKRAFSSEREKDEFWDFLKRKVESVR